jgi:hypothetical protein
MSEPALFPNIAPTPASATERIGKYLVADILPRRGTTDRWTIRGNDGTALGRVAWYSPWRQYNFDPAESTTFNHACLTDIAAFLGKVNAAQRERK